MRAGFPDFPLDDEGFPLPGSVIKYYRDKMKYRDPIDGKEKSWTQADLAKRLAISEVMVRLMETQNASLDSITRRRLLADLLKIPPVLLGIGTLDELMEFLKHHEEGTASLSAISASTITKGSYIEKETISLYRDAVALYSEIHLTGTAQDSLFEIERWIGRITGNISRANAYQKHQLQDVLWDFYDLSAKIYSDDLGKWKPALDYLNAEMEVATLIDSNELRTASLYRSGQMKFAQRQYFSAKVDLDGAVLYAQQAQQMDPQLKSAVFAAAGLAHALVNKDEAGKTEIQRLLDTAEAVVTAGNVQGNGRFVRFNLGKYLLEKADTLIAMNRPSTALRVLDDASESIDPVQRRRHAYIDILRAEANMYLKRPKLDVATDFLTGAFDVSKVIKSEFNISYITRLYGVLREGSYGNSTDVADLGLAIRNWRKA